MSSVILVCCIQANTIECGDLACPSELQCRANRCVTDEQVDACRDHLETDPCTATGVLNGHCLSEVCVEATAPAAPARAPGALPELGTLST